MSLVPTRRQVLGGSLAAAGLAATPAVALAEPARLAAMAASELQRLGRRIPRTDLVGVVDFSRPSGAPRLHLVDMLSGRVQSLLVAHGRGSDPRRSGWVQTFSNAPGSNCSSEGAYLTADYYVGKHGRSMNLEGLEASNSNARARRIVVHGAPYVSPQAAQRQGGVGRSQGCFAVAPGNLAEVLARLGPGRLLVARKFQT